MLGVALWACLVGAAVGNSWCGAFMPGTNMEQTDLTHVHKALDFIPHIAHFFMFLFGKKNLGR